MVASFLAIAEQRNAPVLERLAQEPVRTVGIVGVACAIHSGQAENCERRVGFGTAGVSSEMSAVAKE